MHNDCEYTLSMSTIQISSCLEMKPPTHRSEQRSRTLKSTQKLKLSIETTNYIYPNNKHKWYMFLQKNISKNRKQYYQWSPPPHTLPPHTPLPQFTFNLG